MITSVRDIAASLFLDWPNVTQGLVGSALGSALGVYGAYTVAARQMRHDRDSRRMAAGGEAAASILETLLPLLKQLNLLRNLDPNWDIDQDGLSEGHRRRWREYSSAFEVSLLLRAHLLPTKVATDLEALARCLDKALVWDVDKENNIVNYVTTASEDVLEKIGATAATARQSLTDYARSALGDQR